MRDEKLLICIVLAYGAVLGAADRQGYPGVPQLELPFKGTASGGSLVLATTLHNNARYVSITTSGGESAESIAQSLADTINGLHAAINLEHRLRFHPDRLWIGGYQARASGPNLVLPGAAEDYMLAGTERGLGIPKPPLSLSCSYDQENDKVMLRWINPPGGYDFIIVHCYWTNRLNLFSDRALGTSTTFTADRKNVPLDVNDLDVSLTAFRDNIPSNAAAIHVTGNGHCQGETYGIPFTCGIAPNWTAWTTSGKTDITAVEQEEKYDDLSVFNPVRGFLTKPYYQVIKVPPNGVLHGVYRKFLGLTPGHTYRLTACLSTLDMDSAKGDWSLSLHAAPTTSGKDLSVEQLAGLGALPDGRRGPEVGRIAFYGPGNTTRGDSALVFSGKDAPGGFQSSHITLPAGVDTITLWVRFSCSDPNGKVGFSGVKLEDLTEIKNPKSPAEVIAEENAAEIDLLKWIERASRESPR